MKKQKSSKGDRELIEAVDKHLSHHVGDVSFVVDEIDSPLIHIDVHVVTANSERNHHVLMTSGMSEKPMRVPKAAKGMEYAELMLCLPAKWPINKDAWGDEDNWWPIRLLKDLARYPHRYRTWLGQGHSIRADEVGKSFAANTSLSEAVLLSPMTLTEEARYFHAGDRHVNVWAVFPIYSEELDLKLRDGANALQDLLTQNGITELLDPQRKKVAFKM